MYSEKKAPLLYKDVEGLHYLTKNILIVPYQEDSELENTRTCYKIKEHLSSQGKTTSIMMLNIHNRDVFKRQFKPIKNLSLAEDSPLPLILVFKLVFYINDLMKNDP